MNNKPTPSTILRDEFMAPHGISGKQLASLSGICPVKISRILNNKARINANIAIRLSKVFSTTEQLWTTLQSNYDLKVAREQINIKEVTALSERGERK